MTEPALREDGGVTVVKLYETDRETEMVPSIEAAIEVVKAARSTDSICQKIVTREDNVVYNSDRNGSIEDWEAAWKREMQILEAPSEPVHTCPYLNAGCIEDDPCIQCGMDRQIEEFSTTYETR